MTLLTITLGHNSSDIMEIQIIQQRIHEIRGHKVMLDFDLAQLYEVETRALNQAVRRNIELFPADFMFQLRKGERESMSSQIVMTYPKKRPKSSLPLAFTEHGVIMLANVLRSKKAKQTAVSIVRAFVTLKQFVINYDQISNQLKQLEKQYDKQFQDIYQAINYLIEKNRREETLPNRQRIGFK